MGGRSLYLTVDIYLTTRNTSYLLQGATHLLPQGMLVSAELGTLTQLRAFCSVRAASQPVLLPRGPQDTSAGATQREQMDEVPAAALALTSLLLFLWQMPSDYGAYDTCCQED